MASPHILGDCAHCSTRQHRLQRTEDLRARLAELVRNISSGMIRYGTARLEANEGKNNGVEGSVGTVDGITVHVL